MSESTPIPLASTEETATRRLVWDLPTRAFHWTLALLFAGSFTVALLSSEHSRAFLIHMLLGLVLAFAILLRLVWGLVGSRPSRFSSFLYSPMTLLRYVRDVLAGRDRPSPGHNPGASYAIYGMLLLPLGLVATGLLKASGQEWAEELHAVLAYGMVALVGLHLMGLMWHARRYRDGITLAMVDGRRLVSEAEAIPSARVWAGALFLLLVGGWGFALTQGFDPATRQVSLPGIGTSLSLGEAKEGQAASEDSERHSKKQDDD